MSYQYEREAARTFADLAKQAGFRVFLAERGTYGYITDADGARVVGFQAEFGSIKVSGQYRASRESGTGWIIEDDTSPTSANRDNLTKWLNMPAPAWANRKPIYVTEAEYRDAYQPSSHFLPV